jgi:hypothetical protein
MATARFLLFVFFLSMLWLTDPAQAGNEGGIPVGYGGVYTAGPEKNYPLYLRSKTKLNLAVQRTLERLADEKKLPFLLLFETDVEERKTDVDDPYSLAVVITRDDVASEKFATSAATIHKTLVNVGLVVILYRTVEEQGSKRNAIVFSIPLVGYSQNLEGAKQLSDAEIDDLFVKNATTILEQHLAKRLQNVSLEKINGTVAGVKDGKATISIGGTDGLVEGQMVTFLRNGKKLESRKIVELGKRQAVVLLGNAAQGPQVGEQVYGKNIKGVSDETYQVVTFHILSKKAAALFDEKIIGAQISQWFSDFLVDRAGKVVLPSKIGGEWAETATGVSFMKLVKEGQEHVFEVPPAKYAVTLDLTGVSSKTAEGNNVNEIRLYKAWLKVTVPSKQVSEEYDTNSSKSVISGVQSFQEKAELYDLLHELTAKIAKESHL